MRLCVIVAMLAACGSAPPEAAVANRVPATRAINSFELWTSSSPPPRECPVWLAPEEGRLAVEALRRDWGTLERRPHQSRDTIIREASVAFVESPDADADYPLPKAEVIVHVAPHFTVLFATRRDAPLDAYCVMKKLEADGVLFLVWQRVRSYR